MKTDLVIEPKSRIQALVYALGISGYGLRQVLAKAPIRIPHDRIISCTKVPWFTRSYFVLVFQTDMPSHISLWELPPDAALECKEAKALRFHLDWMLRDWRNSIKTLAATFYILGMIPLALGMVYYAESHRLSQIEYRRYFHSVLSIYSVTFPVFFYRFARPSMKTAWDLRSLQIQTAIILGFAGFLIVRTLSLL